jgi:ADP-L-glycero-D-manno-heptose 6-epimerase
MIVVTGGAGMIGANLLRALNAAGHDDLLVVDDLTDGRKFANLTGARIADYEDQDRFYQRVDAGESLGKIEAIFHQGACSNTSEWNGQIMMELNYRRSKLLFQFAQENNIPFIYASSAAIYGKNQVFVEEVVNESPLNIYAYSKKLFDDYVRAHARAERAPVTGLRYFNVYGPFEGHKAAMASVAFHLFHQVIADQPACLFGAHDGCGPGQQARDFISAADVAAVNLWAWRAGARGIFNCGTGKATPFLEVAQAVIEAVGKGRIEFIDFPDHLVGRYQSFTQANISALRAAGCMHSFTDVRAGVADYVKWLLHA